MRLFEQGKENNNKYGNKVIIADKFKKLTFFEVEEISGKVYRYLKEHDIKTEDIVMINQKRSVYVVTSFLGILKAGACAVIVENAEDNYYSYFLEETNPKLIITDEIFDEILKKDTLDGYEEPNEHDAAFIVFSSSTTALPKGCIHEYGDIDQLIDSLDIIYEGYEFASDRIPIFGGLYDISAIFQYLYTYYCHSFIYIMNLKSEDYFETIKREKLNYAIVLPTITKLEELEKIDSITSLGVAYSCISNVHSNNKPLYNIYGMSESIFEISSFSIEKQYEITPIGKGNELRKIKLLDENDFEVKNGEIGELCFENPYFRGYLNNPQKTKEALKSGIFHSGDMAYCQEDGNYVVVGRKNDVVKTKDGYIIPTIIETEIKKHLDFEIVVSVFEKNEKYHIAVFYTKAFDKEELQNKIKNKIPAYMLPTDYIEINSIPKLKSGKIKRMELETIFREKCGF